MWNGDLYLLQNWYLVSICRDWKFNNYKILLVLVAVTDREDCCAFGTVFKIVMHLVTK
jgi:hypothetical protein